MRISLRPGNTPGSGSCAESNTPSLIWHTRTGPLPGSGVNEMYPAGTGLPLNVTVPEICAICGLEEQPAARAIAATSAAPPSARRARPCMGNSCRGDASPVVAQHLAGDRGRGPLPGQGADAGADGPATAVGQAGDHDVAVQGLQAAVVALVRPRVALDAAGVDHAAVPVLAEVRIGPRAGTGVEVARSPVRVVEHGVVPPGVPVRGGRVAGERQRRARGPVGPVGKRGGLAAAGPDGPGDRPRGQSRGRVRVRVLRPGTER